MDKLKTSFLYSTKNFQESVQRLLSGYDLLIQRNVLNSWHLRRTATEIQTSAP